MMTAVSRHLLVLMVILCCFVRAAEPGAGALTIGPSFPQQPAQSEALQEADRLTQEVFRLFAAGGYDEALPLARRALELREKELGPDHPLVAGSLNNVAELYDSKGDYAKAEPLLLRSLAIVEKALGPDNPELATQINNLAVMYKNKGEFSKAEPLFLRALSIRERSLGPDHPDVATTLDNLALLYRGQGDYKKAAPLFERALAIRENAFGPENPVVGVSVNSLAMFYDSKGEYDKAEPLFRRALAIVENAVGPDDPNLATVLNNLALLYRNKGQYEKAEPLFQRALSIREKALGHEHPFVATALINLGGLYINTGEYAKAEPLLQRAAAIMEKTLGPDHPDTATALNNLALLYRSEGQLSKAEPLFRRELGIYEKAFGPDHPRVATALNNLAELCLIRSDYQTAQKLYQQALGIFEKADGPDHPEVATALNNLAEFYRSQGGYAKAEPLYQRALRIREKALGPDHPDVGSSLNNLAVLYAETGEYTKAEPLYQRALSIRGRALGPNHPDFAASLNNLGTLYLTKGEYGKAAALYLLALSAMEKALGPEATEVATSLNNLAALYESVGEFAKAEPLYQRALAIDEKAYGPEHPSVALNLNNLAELYRNQGEYGRAEPLYRRALSIREKSLGPDNPDVGLSLNNLGLLYLSKREYGKAEPLFQRGLAIAEKAFAPGHPNIAASLNNLARLNVLTSDLAQAVAYQARCNDARELDLSRNLQSGSERQKLLYLETTAYETDLTLSLNAQYAPKDPAAGRLGLTILLRRKGRSLDAMTDSMAQLRRRVSTEDQRLLDALVEARSQLATATLTGPGKADLAQYQAALTRLAEQVDRLESTVSAHNVEFKAQSQPISLEAVQKLIPPSAVLVEFANYAPFDVKTLKYGPRRFLAYTLAEKGEPRWVDLGEAAPIETAVAALREALRDAKRADVKQLARALDAKVMQPVRALVGQGKWLLLSPDGALNLIPFGALVDEKGDYLVTHYLITYLTSGRDLLRFQARVSSKRGPLIMADPDFGSRGNPVVGQEPTNREQSQPSLLSGAYFSPLPGTAGEGAALKSVLLGSQLLTGREATKAALAAVDGPAVLHIATHGFFLEDNGTAAPIQSQVAQQTTAASRLLVHASAQEAGPSVRVENPLLRSGLALAGANAPASTSDGILTALETAGLSLWGTKLVVLSACDTGVGEVRNGEGVYGLRRALVLAGSESQVMSLWPVKDAATRDLMIDYYKALQAGQGRSEALREVQLKMLQDSRHSHPAYWASFIQLGQWGKIEGLR